MPVPGKNAVLFWDAYNLQRYLNKITPDRSSHLEDVTAFGSNGVERLATGPDAKLDMAGYWNSNGDTGPDDILIQAIGGVGGVVSYFPQGVGTLGNFGQVYALKNGGYKMEAPSLTGVLTFTAGGEADESGHTGRLLHILQSEAGAVNGAAVDLGASHAAGLSPRGYVQNLHVSEFTGVSAVIKTQWSADGSTGWVDIATFTTVSDLTGQHLSGATATIGRYVRYTLTGTFTSITFLVLFAKR